MNQIPITNTENSRAPEESFFSYPQETTFGKLKNSAGWKSLVEIAAPLFSFAWEWIINLPEKVIYLLSPYRGPLLEGLRVRSVEYVYGKSNLVNFAEWLLGSIPASTLSTIRNELLADNDLASYATTIEARLPREARLGLLRFALSEENLHVVMPYFRVAPRLNSIRVMYNIVKPGFQEEGSKSWHLDDGYYRSLNLFLCITPLGETNGIYRAIGTDACSRHAAIPLESIDRRLSPWINQRHSDALMAKYVPAEAVMTLAGPSGTAAWVDSGACYHKGGHCLSAERIMLQIHYSTELSAPQESVLVQLGLAGDPEALALVNNRMKRYLTKGTATSWSHRLAMKLRNPIYFIGKRLLCYYLKPLPAKAPIKDS